MIESEVKILEVDSEKIQAKLVELGAVKIFDDEIHWTVFDYPDRSLSKNEVLLRLRKKGDGGKLAYKKLLTSSGAKVSEELEVATSSYQTTAEILEKVGLVQKKGYPLQKHRTSYILEARQLHVDIDTIEPIPTFMEIEGNDINEIELLATELGFAKADLKPWGLREVFAHYRSIGKVT